MNPKTSIQMSSIAVGLKALSRGMETCSLLGLSTLVGTCLTRNAIWGYPFFEIIVAANELCFLGLFVSNLGRLFTDWRSAYYAILRVILYFIVFCLFVPPVT